MQFAAILWIIGIITYTYVMCKGEERRNGKSRRYYTILRNGIGACVGIVLLVGSLFIIYLR